MYITEYENKLLDNLKKAKYVSLDTETVSLVDKTMVGFSFAYDDFAFYVPIRDEYLDNMPEHQALHLLNFIMANCHVIFHNASFDIPVLDRFQVIMPKDLCLDDTLIMANLVNENMRHGLKKLALKYFKYKQMELKEICGAGLKRIDFHKVKSVKKVKYACDDAKYTLKLYHKLSELLSNDRESFAVYSVLENPLINVVAQMHINGIRIDLRQVEQISAICKAKVDKAEAKLKCLIGDINFGSSKQLKEYFIDKCHMPILKVSDKTGAPSVAKEVLKVYAETNLEAKLILDFRKYSKILSTFIPALLPRNHDGKTGHIYASFNQAGTVSGRFSSSRPNMQNIPRDAEKDDPEYLGIRECFIPEEGHILIGADYSQIELRVLAHFSQDKNLLKAYEEELDIHQQTADALNITRQQAKTVNFGIVYGMGAKTLAKQIDVSPDTGQHYIEKYFETYPLVHSFWKTAETAFRTFGYVQTISGRKRRRTKEFFTKDDFQQSGEIRSAINSIIQGSAADLIKQAMIVMHKRLQPFGAKLILTVHDEVLVSCPIKYAKSCFTIIESSMLEAGKQLSVPVKVDIKYGRTWAEAHGDGIKLEEIK